MAENNKKQKSGVLKKIEVEIVPSTNVKSVEEVKKRMIEETQQTSSDSVADESSKNGKNIKSGKKRPKKKWKKQDFIQSGQMPPANKLIPAIILLVMLVATYVSFNSLVFVNKEDDDFHKSKMQTGWKIKIAELEEKYSKQQSQLRNLQLDIKKHSSLIAEHKTQIGQNNENIKNTKAELSKVDEDLKNLDKKTEAEQLKLLKKHRKLQEELKKLEDEQNKMKETDEQLKKDVKELDNRYREAEKRMDSMAGDVEKGNKERQKMREDFMRLLDDLRKQGIEVPDYGDDPNGDGEEKNQP
ncbi:MAG: hypothetical protein K8S87_05785 [Planctomycetes bacterium]|nr:hypothetical protein [Planctomycetota bacterium]